MALDVTRHIEVFTEDIVGSYDSKDMPKLGKLEVGDVVLVYCPDDGKHNYMQITGISVEGPDSDDERFIYTPIETPSELKDYANWKMPEISRRVEFTKELPLRNETFNEGDVIKVYGDGTHYYKYNNNEWVEIEKAPASWKAIKIDGDDTGFGDLKNTFVNEYLCSRGYHERESEFISRGFPNDVTEDVRKNISEYEFGVTWCLLSDIDKISDEEIIRLKNSLKEAIKNDKMSIVESKIDRIIGILNKQPLRKSDEDENYEPSFDEIYDEEIYNVLGPHAEYNKIESIVKVKYGNVSDNKVRIIYAFNN